MFIVHSFPVYNDKQIQNITAIPPSKFKVPAICHLVTLLSPVKTRFASVDWFSWKPAFPLQLKHSLASLSHQCEPRSLGQINKCPHRAVSIAQMGRQHCSGHSPSAT